MAKAPKEDKHERSAPGLTRRVQRTGSSSLSITLPKSWTDSMNLQTGDVLRFRDLGEGRLEISQANAEAPEERRQRLLRIDATDVPANLLVRLLIGAYITGQDQVIVTTRGGLAPAQRQEIRRTVGHVLGMTVVEEDANGVEIQNFVDPGKYQLHRLLNQLVRMIRSELEACQAALASGDRAPLAQLPAIEDEVDRFYLLMVRQLLLSSDDFQVARDIGVESHHYQIGYRLLAKTLELTGDLVAGVGRELNESLPGLRRAPKSSLAEILAVLARFDRLLAQTMDAFARLSPVDANATLNEIDRSLPADQGLGDALARRISDRHVAVAAQRIVSNIVMATEMLVIVNEVTINRAVEPETVAKTDRQVGLHTMGAAEPPRRPPPVPPAPRDGRATGGTVGKPGRL
jgi:phosphate uptake regulator